MVIQDNLMYTLPDDNPTWIETCFNVIPYLLA